jgi:two-component system, cell cycle sensor histidine kinase and response regulator CckA
VNDVARVLVIEDSESDAALAIRQLEKAGLRVEAVRVETPAGLRAALADGQWDVILADYHLPQFDAPSALAMVRESGRDIPFIVVSARIGEDVAVDMMRAGAHDYVLKDSLARLAPAVEREMREARLRRERAQANAELERQRAVLVRQAELLNLSRDAIVTMDAGRRITAWNSGAREIYGWTEAEAAGNPMDELLATASERAPDLIAAALEGAGRWDGELLQTRRDGTRITVESRQVLTRDAAGRVTGILQIDRDVTARKVAEEALWQALLEAEDGRRLLDAMMRYIPLGLAIADVPDLRISRVSRHGLEMMGVAEDSFVPFLLDELGERWPVFHPGGQRAATGEWPLARAARGGEHCPAEEWEIEVPGGARIAILCTAAPIRDAAGVITGAVVAWQDIAERKRIEERLRHAQKAESIGFLAAGIAHDFNNILTAISGNVSLAMDELCAGCAHAGSNLEIAIDSVRRAAALTRQLLAYAGKGAILRAPVAVSEVGAAAGELLRASLSKKVELQTDLAVGLPPVLADAGQIEQVFVNLIVNGAEAIGESRSGSVTVRTFAVGGMVAIEVSDTGCGMDEETRRRIFDPFFTTKFLGRGLGLAAVHGIVGTLGGEIAVDSAPGKGTRMSVFLPHTHAAAPPPAPAPPLQAAASLAAATGTVLIVDDEPALRRMAAATLETHGIAAVQASTGREAIERLKAGGNEIRAVLLDLTMPDMYGNEALPGILALRPDMPVIVSSGYGDLEVERQFCSMRVRSFLPKPYTGEQLLAHVRAALEGPDTEARLPIAP